MSKGNLPTIGIIVSGGPAPGINSVISSVVISARNAGCSVLGLKDGFDGICQTPMEPMIELTIEMVSRIQSTGGSILGTSRFNPFANDATTNLFLERLRSKSISALVVIGGEGSAYLSKRLGEVAPHISVIHVPKTIDNDISLPNHHPSFGFESARFAGQGILETLMVDARTTKRWFLVTTMGRKAGFLALGLGLASGATITLIPEEFSYQKHSLSEISKLIMASVRARQLSDRDYGVALIAEGVIDCLDPHTVPELKEAPRDALGRINYAEVEIEDIIARDLRSICKAEQRDVKFITKNIGYELRCSPPISFDIEYTRFLGVGAVQLLLEGKRALMVTKDYDRIGAIPLEKLADQAGRIISRQVDLSSDLYRVARSFMVR